MYTSRAVGKVGAAYPPSSFLLLAGATFLGSAVIAGCATGEEPAPPTGTVPIAVDVHLTLTNDTDSEQELRVKQGQGSQTVHQLSPNASKSFTSTEPTPFASLRVDLPDCGGAEGGKPIPGWLAIQPSWIAVAPGDTQQVQVGKELDVAILTSQANVQVSGKDRNNFQIRLTDCS